MQVIQTNGGLKNQENDKKNLNTCILDPIVQKYFYRTLF